MEAEGEAIIFVSPGEENDLDGIEKALGRAIPRVTLPNFDYKAPPPPKVHGHPGRGSRGPLRWQRRIDHRPYRRPDQ